MSDVTSSTALLKIHFISARERLNECFRNVLYFVLFFPMIRLKQMQSGFRNTPLNITFHFILSSFS